MTVSGERWVGGAARGACGKCECVFVGGGGGFSA